METTFLKIIQSSDVIPVTTLLTRLDNLLAGGTRQESGVVGEGSSGAGSSLAKKKQFSTPVAAQKADHKQAVELDEINAQPEVPVSPSVTVAPPPEQIGTGQDAAEGGSTPDDRPASPPKPTNSPEEKPALRSEPHQQSVRRDWMAFIAYVRDRSVWMSQDLQRADSAKEEGHELLLHYEDPANCTLLRKDDTKKLITEFALDFFQKELSVRFVIPEQGSEVAPDGQESPLKERHLLANDPLVQMTAEIFNGQVGDIRVGPRFR